MIESVDQFPKIDFQIPAPRSGNVVRDRAGEGVPDVVGRRNRDPRMRARRHVHVIGVGGDIVDGMGPRVGEQCLQAVSEAMPELRLQRIVARARAVSHQIELAGEIGIRRAVKVLPHELARPRSDVGQGDRHPPFPDFSLPMHSTHRFWAIRDSDLRRP